MAASVIVDTSYLIALLSRREAHHRWADEQALRFPPPWKTCEAVLSEAFHLLEAGSVPALVALLQRTAVVASFRFNENWDSVLELMRKYSSVPISFADACLVRMTEVLDDPVLLTIDSDFRIYRRHSRKIIPCVMPT